jgi:hypothetical protein
VAEATLPEIEVTAKASAPLARDEHRPDQIQTLFAALAKSASDIRVAMPGIIESFDPATQTCTVNLAIKVRALSNAGEWESREYSKLTDVPVEFPSGGGCTITFPVQPGDECVVEFADRCIDSWWQSGGIQEQAEIRMHDLSDGFARITSRSKPRVPADISATTAQFRTDEGDTYIEIDPASGGIVTIKSPNTVTIDAPLVEFTGKIHAADNIDTDADMTADGTVTGTANVVAGTIELLEHDHQTNVGLPVNP